jgi:hypothetical protein
MEVDFEIKAYLREIGPTIPAVVRAMELFGDGALQLWIEEAVKPS